MLRRREREITRTTKERKQDPTKGNDKLAKELNQSYKKHVTQFMRDVVSLVRKIK